MISDASALETGTVSQSETVTGSLPDSEADKGMIAEASASAIMSLMRTAANPRAVVVAGTVRAELISVIILDYYCRRRASVRKQRETSYIRLISSQTRFEAPK
jgi:hypothetical protein